MTNFVLCVFNPFSKWHDTAEQFPTLNMIYGDIKQQTFKIPFPTHDFFFLSSSLTLTHLLISLFSLSPFFLSLRSISLPTLYFLLSIGSCRLSCVSFRARTGLWAWTVLTCVMATNGKRTCRWSFSRTMRVLTAGSLSRLPTSRLSHRTESHRWVQNTRQRQQPSFQSQRSHIMWMRMWA